MGGRRVEHDLGAVEAEAAPALGEVAVVADVDADLADGGVEHRIPDVAGREIELLPEPLDLRDVLLAVLAEVGAVGVDHGGGVVVQPGLHDLVHRQHHHHAELLGDRLEALGGRPVRESPRCRSSTRRPAPGRSTARRTAPGSTSPGHPGRRPHEPAARACRSSTPCRRSSRSATGLLELCSPSSPLRARVNGATGQETPPDHSP